MIEALQRVAPVRVVRRQVSVTWTEVETRLGFDFPVDYKQLVEVYGPGIFGGFIHIFQPEFALLSIDLEVQIATSLAALIELEDCGEKVPFRLDEPAEIIAVGRTDNGDILYFRRSSVASSDRWTIVLNEARGDEWNYFDGGLTDFLVSALSGVRRFSVFPVEFPLDVAPFEPYGEVAG